MPFAAGYNYRIINVETGTLLDIDMDGRSIIASDRHGSDTQIWAVLKDCDQYVFRSSFGKYFAPEGPVKNNGQVTTQTTYYSWPMARDLSNSDVLQFYIPQSDYVLTGSDDGASVMIRTKNGGKNQWWTFERV